MIATWRHMLATDPRVERMIGPLDFRIFHFSFLLFDQTFFGSDDILYNFEIAVLRCDSVFNTGLAYGFTARLKKVVLVGI